MTLQQLQEIHEDAGRILEQAAELNERAVRYIATNIKASLDSDLPCCSQSLINGMVSKEKHLIENYINKIKTIQ